jgi:glutamate carboxypeptidase
VPSQVEPSGASIDVSAEISSNEPRIDADEILRGILEWVEIESPSHDGEAVNRMVDRVQAEMRAVDALIERIPGRDGFGDILKTRTPWGGDGPGILVLSHVDTVHPIGMKEEANPIRREDDKVYGPGIYDMKGGAYLAYYALRHLVRCGRETQLPITFIYVPEEEIGSPTSRRLIEETALANKYVLVTEPAREGGKIVTARKGVLHFHLTTRGRPAHAGSRHQDGSSAIREMARLIGEIESLTDYGREITANVGLVSGGSGINVVPALCTAQVDMRAPDMAAAREMVNRMHALRSGDPGVTLEVEGGINRPPYEKDAGIDALFEHARAIAADLGLDLEDLKTGGGSDGNFTAALGVPTLDGLGVDGYGAHTDYEHMYYSCLEQRVKLIQGLFETLK